MAMVQIRDVPDGLHRELKARAARAGLSLSDYLKNELEQLTARPDLAEVLERAERQAPGVPSSAVVAAIRADRDAR